MGTKYPKYPRVLMIFLTGIEHSHRNWRYVSQVLMTFLMGTRYPLGYSTEDSLLYPKCYDLFSGVKLSTRSFCFIYYTGCVIGKGYINLEQ